MNTLIANLSKNATNAEINQALEAQLSTGKVILFSVEQSRSGDSNVAYFAQSIQTSQTSSLKARLMGWKNERIVRTIVPFTQPQEFAAIFGGKPEVGLVLPNNFGIEVIEKTVAAYSGQQPKINPSTNEVITHKGLPVYEHSELVEGVGKIVTLERDVETTLGEDMPNL